MGSDHFLQMNFGLRLPRGEMATRFTRLLAFLGALQFIGTLVLQFLIRAAHGIELLAKCSKGI